jgi:hypothetical protein
VIAAHLVLPRSARRHGQPQFLIPPFLIPPFLIPPFLIPPFLIPSSVPRRSP